MKLTDVRWNDAARSKILDDSDRVLRDAVADLATAMHGHDADDVYSALYARLKDRFIDFEPGPDIRKYSDSIAAGEIEGGADAQDSASGTTESTI